MSWIGYEFFVNPYSQSQRRRVPKDANHTRHVWAIINQFKVDSREREPEKVLSTTLEDSIKILFSILREGINSLQSNVVVISEVMMSWLKRNFIPCRICPMPTMP
jgi:hypothetical protein